MACRFGFMIAILAVFLGAPPAKAQSGGNVGGIWLTQAGDARVRVSKCGGGICGVIVWLKDPINGATGKPQVDDKNHNPSLARRPMIGLPLFSGMRCSTAEAVEGFRPIALRAEGCRVTARVGRVCIVRFRDECTELPGCERSLSRCRRRGGVFRAGWAVNQGSLYS